MKAISLKRAWDDRLKLKSKGDKLIARWLKTSAKDHTKNCTDNAEGSEKVTAKKDKSRIEELITWTKYLTKKAEKDKLYSEGIKIRLEADKLFIDVVIKIRGDIKIEWKNFTSKKNDCECHLDSGEIFKP